MWPWVAVLFISAAAACACYWARAAAEALWLRPRRLERHFARQGVKGPGYSFFVGSSVELVRLMLDAASRPMAPQDSHHVVPRVLPFYHRWRQLYGKIRTHFDIYINDRSMHQLPIISSSISQLHSHLLL